MKVYLLWFDDQMDTVYLLGVYSTKEKAEKALSLGLEATRYLEITEEEVDGIV